MIMNQQTMKHAVVIAIAGAVALGAVTTVSAAPVLSSTTALNNAAPSSVIDVRYYRHGNYHNYGPGVAFGALGAAAAIAGAATYGNGYYGDRYYGNRGYYGRNYYGGGPYYGY
jgi:transposase